MNLLGAGGNYFCLVEKLKLSVFLQVFKDVIIIIIIIIIIIMETFSWFCLSYLIQVSGPSLNAVELLVHWNLIITLILGSIVIPVL